MTDKHLYTEMLKAVRDLRRKYLGKRQYSKHKCETAPAYNNTPNGCPLCLFTLDFVKQHHEGCPWLLFEGAKCYTLEYLSQPIPDRLARIDRWEVEIKKRIKEAGA
jgi:hypothetical protein